jgi:hypothetical protein
VTDLTDCILELIHVKDDFPSPASRQRHREIERLQEKAAAEFGKTRGWRVSAQGFEPKTLARRGVHSGHNWDYYKSFPLDFIDHPVFYRGADGRAAAVVGQPYANAFKEDEATAWAAENDLQISFPTETSWWYPRWTRIVLFEPLA